MSSGLHATVFNVMRFATHDGPGIRTTVFFKGCPLDCWWCHNPEGQVFQPSLWYFAERCRHCGDCAAVCPQHGIGATGESLESAHCTACGTCAEVCQAEARQISGRRLALAELIAEIERDQVFFDESGGGVTLSGGEPTARPRFTGALLAECAARGIHTVLETCGYSAPATFLPLALAAGQVLFDLKLMDAARHRQYTGVSNRPILKNLEALTAHRRDVVVRIPVIPGVNDTDAEIAAFAEYLPKARVHAVELLPYHRVGSEKYRRLRQVCKLPETREPAADDLRPFAKALSDAGLDIAIGGLP